MKRPSGEVVTIVASPVVVICSIFIAARLKLGPRGMRKYAAAAIAATASTAINAMSGALDFGLGAIAGAAATACELGAALAGPEAARTRPELVSRFRRFNSARISAALW